MATLRTPRGQRHLTRERRASPRPAILRRLARALAVGIGAIDPAPARVAPAMGMPAGPPRRHRGVGIR